jgi:hypothetical protein
MKSIVAVVRSLLQIKKDFTGFNGRRKNKAWKDKNITVVAPSSWIAECSWQQFIV